MKRIFLVRHAHSDAGTPNTPDFERRLSPLGRRDALKTTDQMKKWEFEPGIFKISPAARAKETAQIILSEYPQISDHQIQYESRLYLPSVSVLWESIRDTSETYDSLVLIAHNMGLEELIRTFKQDERMNPGSIAELIFKGTWKEAHPSTSGLRNLFHP